MSVGQRTVRAGRGACQRGRGRGVGARAGRGEGGGRSGVAPLQPVQALRTTATHYEGVDGLHRSPWGVALH